MAKLSGGEPDTDKERLNLKTTEKVTGPMASVGTFASLRIPNFRLLLTGTLFSNAAQWIQMITLNWLVYDLTGSGTMLGAINLVRSFASLGMIPVAGILIDRVDRRILMVIANCWLFVITLVLGLLLLFGCSQVWFLFVFSFLGGLAQAIDMNLRQVMVFDLVPRLLTPNALAIIQTGWSLMRSFGPGIGGFLILWFGPGGNFLIQAGAYVLIAITIIQIQFPKRKGEMHSSPLGNILEGIRYVASGRITRTFMLLGLVLPLVIIPIFAILPPVYAVEVFGDKSGKVLGFLMASVGVGGIFGGIVTASLGRVERRGLVQLISLLLLSLTLICFALSKALWLALLLLVLSGFFEMIFLTTNQTLLQLSIPDNLRGRVTSVVNLNSALFPLGGLIAGVGSDLLRGPKLITILLAGISAGVAVCVFLGSKTVRNHRLSEAIDRD
jgi:MFS family permease